MKAYVAIRGSRSARSVDRDASPGKHMPYAALVLAPENRPREGYHRFELSYRATSDGRVFVDLIKQSDGQRRENVGTWEV